MSRVTASFCAVVILSHCLASSSIAEVWITLSEEGNRLREHGRCRQAVPVLLRARSAAANELGSNHASVAIPINNLAAAYLCLGEFTQAERNFRAALALVDSDPSPEMKAGILNNLGILLMRLSRMKEAEEVFHKAIGLSETAHGPHHLVTAAPVTSLGVLRLQAGQYTHARDLFQRSFGIYAALLGDHPDTATSLNNLGVVCLYLREYDQARDFTARAHEMRLRMLPPGHPDIAQSLYNHAVALDRLGQRKSARNAFRQAAALRSTFASENRLGVTVDVKRFDGK